MKRLLWFAFLLSLTLMTGGARAQDTLGIAAVVNDKVISVYDLSLRINTVVVFSGLPDTPETRQRLVPQVLQTLIDDELKRQEAKRLGVSISEGEINRALRNLEKINDLSRGGLDSYLAKRNLKKSSLTNQIKADIAWQKLVNGRFFDIAKIRDEDIDAVLAEIRRNEGKPEYLVSEIFLPVDRADDEPKVLAQANQLVEQIISGANFSALALNFSKSPTAGKGGNLGWNRIGQLGAEIDNTLARMQPGQLSKPIRTNDGYTILLFRTQRTTGKAGSSETGSAVVNLQQFFIPIPKGASPTAVADAMDGAKIAGEQAKSCEDLDKISKKIGSTLSGNLGDLKTSALAPQQRTLIRGLPPLKASQPMRMSGGVMVLMVCRRDEPKVPDMSPAAQRERIADRLLNERLAIMARQYLRDVRRAAFIEVRL